MSDSIDNHALTDSVLFDRYQTIDCHEINGLCESIFSLIREENPVMRSVDDGRLTLKQVLINLFYADVLEVTPYVAYSRDNNQFGPGTRYKALGISRTALKRATDWLSSHGYTSGAPGFKDPDSGIGFVTRMRATPKLRYLFEQFGWSPSMIVTAPPSDAIALKNCGKEEISYADTPEIIRMRDAVERVNEFLSTVSIHIRGRLQPVGYYRRIFNRGSFKYGGRWYGHWILGRKNNTRKTRVDQTREHLVKHGYLTLNDEPTIELDYHALHLVMLYHKKNLQPGFSNGYDLSEFGFDKSFAPLIKLCVMCMINNLDQESARRAVQKEINLEGLEEFRGVHPLPIFQALKKAHWPVVDLLLQDSGVRLQRTDSTIVERIMLGLMDIGIPALCLHDSFIVPRQYQKQLIKLMVSEYQAEVGFGAPLIHT